MKMFILSAFALLLLASCNNSNNGNDIAVKEDSLLTAPNRDIDSALSLTGCYLRIIKRDTVALTLKETGNTVSGKLNFDNYEKDASSGSVTGTIDNDILKLIYNLQSEGMNSVMEVYFKITGKGLIQGIGEVKTKSDTTCYANFEKIIYPTGNELLKTSCDRLDVKYK